MPITSTDVTTSQPQELKIEKIKKADLTIISALDQIYNVVRKEQLNPQCLKKINTTISYLTKRLGISQIQAMFLAPIINNAPKGMTIERLALFFNCTNLHVMRYNKDLEYLVEKKLLQFERKYDNEVYCVPQTVMNAFKENKIYIETDDTNFTTEKIFEKYNEMFSKFRQQDSNMPWEDYMQELRIMLRANKSSQFAQKIKEYNLDDSALVVLMTFCLNYIFNNTIHLDTNFFTFIPARHYMGISSRLHHGRHILQKLNLVEDVNKDRQDVPIMYKLTDFAKKELLSEVTQKNTKERNNLLTYADSIVAKHMFYNSEEEIQLKQLYSLLENERFVEVQKRLKECGMRTGFACLFYGAPGTGKTETVLQLARQTGRNIMQVNLEEIRSKWVGESEKNIKDIFTRYRSFAQTEHLTPILFFNEADAIFGKRIENISHEVDKMENTILNIILQEIENFNGILIATTNLDKNLDKAFERRFLYKIKFQNPGFEAQKSIWKSMFSELDNAAITELCTMYSFSGGQIENIARKRTIKNIIDGEKITLAQIKEFCNVEKMNRTERNKIGFGK